MSDKMDTDDLLKEFMKGKTTPDGQIVVGGMKCGQCKNYFAKENLTELKMTDKNVYICCKCFIRLIKKGYFGRKYMAVLLMHRNEMIRKATIEHMKIMGYIIK